MSFFQVWDFKSEFSGLKKRVWKNGSEISGMKLTGLKKLVWKNGSEKKGLKKRVWKTSLKKRVWKNGSVISGNFRPEINFRHKISDLKSQTRNFRPKITDPFILTSFFRPVFSDPLICIPEISDPCFQTRNLRLEKNSWSDDR